MTATPTPTDETTFEMVDPVAAASLTLLEADYLRLAAELQQCQPVAYTHFALRDLSPFGR